VPSSHTFTGENKEDTTLIPTIKGIIKPNEIKLAMQEHQLIKDEVDLTKKEYAEFNQNQGLTKKKNALKHFRTNRWKTCTKNTSRLVTTIIQFHQN
jgi:hypothetical protein